MKNLLLIIGFTCIAGAASAQEVLDAKHNVVAYITRATIMDKNHTVLYTFNGDGRIVDPQANTVGFLLNNTEMQNKDHVTVGYITFEGQVQDRNHQSIGSINYATGPIIKNGNVIATMTNVEPMWAAAYFFLLKP